MTADDIYRILAPSEYKALLAAIPKIDKRILVETMLNTGMRYEELRRFGDNPQWFSAKGREIKLPAASTKTIEARSVHLTPAFSEKLELYLSSNELKFPLRQAMAKDLKRWWLVEVDDVGHRAEAANPPVPKTFRKTWVTWLVFAQPYHLAANNGTIYSIEAVEASMGHEHKVSTKHYQRLVGSLKNEVEAVKELTRGWMT